MCGIAGFFRKTEKQFEPEQLIALLGELEHRGRDATGWAWGTSRGNAALCKSAGPAKLVLQQPKADLYLRASAKAQWAFYHCRQSTGGTPQDNRNNHPIYTNEAVVIHNGLVHTTEPLACEGECDSEILGRLIDKYGIEECLTHFSGSVAFAAFLFSDPEAIYLYREDNPIRIIDNPEFIAFASTVSILDKLINLPYNESRDLPVYSLYRVSASGLTLVKTVEHSAPTYVTYPSSQYAAGNCYHYEEGRQMNLDDDPFLTGEFVSLRLNKTAYDDLTVRSGLKKRNTTVKGTWDAERQIFEGTDNHDYTLFHETGRYRRALATGRRQCNQIPTSL